MNSKFQVFDQVFVLFVSSKTIGLVKSHSFGMVVGLGDQDIYVELVFFNPFSFIFFISVHEFELDVEEQQRRVNEGLDKEDDLRYNLMSLTN